MGYGLGRGLVRAVIDVGEGLMDRGAVVLDTVNEAMPEAAELYRSLGFEETGRFNDKPHLRSTVLHFKASRKTGDK